MKLLVAWNIVLLISLLGLGIHFNNSMTPKELVYQTCQTSRMSATIDEGACGELQDTYGMEFLCQQNNTLASNHCWVEEK